MKVYMPKHPKTHDEYFSCVYNGISLRKDIHIKFAKESDNYEHYLAQKAYKEVLFNATVHEFEEQLKNGTLED